mgnify:CR=1 FL=1
MQNDKRVHKGVCLALAACILFSYGSPALAATRKGAENIVTSDELYNAMSARAGKDAAVRASVQKILGRSEVQLVAARAGLDLKQAQAAVSVLSGDELRAVADQAQRVDEALAGGTNIVITSTMIIIALLVLIFLLVAR